MRGTALALVALAATAREARSVPTRFLEGALGSPAVRPPPSPERGSREISFFATVALSETPGASPDLTLSVSSDRQAARDGASTSSKHDLYAHMPSRTTKVGEGSVSAEEIAAKALKVMERLARSAAEREAFAHAPPDGDDERTESTYDDNDDDDDDASLGADGASDAVSTPSAPYHFDPEATTEWDDPWDEAYVDDDAHYGDDYEYAMVDEAGLGRVFDAEGSALPSMDERPRGGDARVRFGDERRTSSLPRDDGGGSRRRKADVGYPLAALGDAASETLRGLGADPRASPNRPDAAALGGARKPGSDVFLDDFTRSFEDQWGDDLDAAEAKRAEKARRRRAKAAKAKAEAAKAEAAKAEAERAEAQRAEAERAEAERAEEAVRAARAKARADAKVERRAAAKAAEEAEAAEKAAEEAEAAEKAAAEKAAAEKAAAEKAATEKAEARSTAAALGRSRTKTSSSSKTSKTSKSPKPAEAKLAKAKSSKRSRRRATAPRDAKTVDIDDLFDAIERGKVGAASVEPEPEPEPSAGDYGDYDVGGGDDYGDYDHTPETKPETKRGRGSEKTSGRRRANEPTSTDSETDDAPSSDASALVADDDLYRFDVPGVDETAVRMYVDGGREYFNDLYEKGADWVNAKYETAANTTQLWVDEYEESGRSKKRLKVDVFLDAADPYSLELVLGPIQNLLRMDLGPLAWTFHAHSNVGQNRGRRANCGGEIAGSAARVSCVANAAVQCSQDVFQNMTSGLGRFEKRAEEIAARRARVKRAKAALGATKKKSSFSENETSDRRLDDEARLVRAPHTSRVKTSKTSRGVLSVSSGEEDYAATTSPSEDYVKQDTFVDLFEPDDDASSYDSGYDADDVDVSSYDVPSLPSLFPDGGEGGEASAEGGLSRFDDTTAPLNVFLTCLSTKLLEMESASAFAFGDANKEQALLDMSATCCKTAAEASASVGGIGYESALLAMCREQASCLATDRGFSLLSNASDALEALTPKHKWLPWVLVEQKPVCVHSCNLQQGIRRAVCNNREGTLPSDCPRFPWSKIWYDEPGVSFAGVFGVFFGLALVAFSMALLAQQAGCCARRKKRDDPERGKVDENSPLLGSPAATRSEEDARG